MWQLLDPGMLWWLAAGVPAIVILYFLKLRRQEHVTSSTLLWKRSVYDLRVNAPLQMIRRNLLLLLQLIILTLIIIALARPFTKLRRAQGRRAALILDVSASMATRDVDGATRLEAAKAEALRMIDDLGVKGEGASVEDELCVITAADRPVVLCGLTSDKQRLRNAVASITGTKNTATDMAAALEMATAVTYVAKNLKELNRPQEIGTAPRTNTKEEDTLGRSVPGRQMKANVILLSDGAFGDIPARLADKLAGGANGENGVGSGSRFLAFGSEATDNLALVALDLRADRAGLGERKLFVRIENMGEKEKQTGIEITLNGTFLDRKDVLVPPRRMLAASGQSGVNAPGQVGLIFAVPEGASGVVTASLEQTDSLPVDNVVHAVLTPPEPIRVLLVTPSEAEFGGSHFIETALQVDKHNVTFTIVASDAYTEALRDKDGKPYEIVIFDRFSPEAAPLGASLFIDAVPNLPGMAQNKERPYLYAPAVVDWNRAHPLMRGLSLLDRLNILKCRNLELEGAWNTVMDGQGLLLASADDLSEPAKVNAADEAGVPLLACMVMERRRVGVLAFNIWETERWPWRVSFPLFIRNAVHWLARPSGIQRAVTHRTGETLRVEYAEAVSSATVTGPDGTEYSPAASGERGFYFSCTDQPGVYRVTAKGQSDRLFACNLLSSDESDNRMRRSIRFGDETLGASREPAKSNVDLWPYLAAAALLVLLAEWYVYNRRILG